MTVLINMRKPYFILNVMVIKVSCQSYAHPFKKKHYQKYYRLLHKALLHAFMFVLKWYIFCLEFCLIFTIW